MLALLAVLAGCTPAGPSALLRGKKLLDAGDYAGAVEQLKNATSLLQTNAQAWNYYGVALQQAGRLDDAALAYQTALKYDRDLVEAHFNLGSLAAEQGKTDMARSEFTAYTLRRPNDADGWLKLGTVQLKFGETAPAERSFSTAYHLETNNPAALNGLGLARIRSGAPRDAAKFFAWALTLQPDYAPALLNLATVNAQYLNDTPVALENYKKYLTLTPRPADWQEVQSLVTRLETPEPKPAATAASAGPVAEINPPPKESPVNRHPVSAPRPKPAPVAKTAPPAAVEPKPAVKPLPVERVEVRAEPAIVATPRTTEASAPVTAQPTPLLAPMPEEQPKKSLWNRLFGSSDKTESKPEDSYRGPGVTPLPGNATDGTQPRVIPAAKPLEVAPAKPAFARYKYYAPAKPAAGDRTAANGAFTKARLAEQDDKWTDALNWYRQAATLDPSWFEAQYNSAAIAQRLRNYAIALPRYELALAIQPDSVEARYNFALVLRDATYVVDAAQQLKEILKNNPREIRAHLALGNLYAGPLEETAQAREHYLKVLELDPNNAQAMDIRYWLSANPK